MITRHRLLILLCALACVLSFELATSEVHTGIGRLICWDFSDSTIACEGEWDIDVVTTRAGSAVQAGSPLTPWLFALGGITVMPPGTTFEETTEAPTDSSLYTPLHLFLWPSRIWVLRTLEGYYAKLRLLDDLTLTNLFEYAYQDNGTPFFFDPPVPVENTTWGKIKSLYE